MMEFLQHLQANDFIGWIMTGVIGYGVKSVAELNENIKIIVLRIDTHEKTLDDHEDRLRAVE